MNAGSAGARPVVVLDAGKRGQEHFEFNRGVLLALMQAGVPVELQAFASMAAVQASLSRAGGGSLRCAPYSWWGMEERLPARWAGAFTKIISVGLSLQALWRSRRSRLVVAYAAPISHLVLAGLARFRRTPLTVYLHAEVEFLHRGRPPAMVGERLMLAALRAAPPHLTYLVLTQAAADELVRSGATRARVSFSPHPISPLLLERPVAAKVADSGAFSMVKSSADIENVRRLLMTLPDAIATCRYNGDGSIAAHGPSADELIASRRYLSREQLEQELISARFFLFPAAETAYAYTASGLACSAASAGTRVVGLPNGFMKSYAQLYPQAFQVVGPGIDPDAEAPAEEAKTATVARPMDNLADVARSLLDDASGRQ